MRKHFFIILPIISIVIFSAYGFASVGVKIIYTSPVDNSNMVKTSESLIFKTDKPVTTPLGNFKVRLKESSGRIITGVLTLAADNRTLVYDPKEDFQPGALVTAELFKTGIKAPIKSISFHTVEKNLSREESLNALSRIYSDEFRTDFQLGQQVSRQESDTLPEGFPAFSITTNTNPSSGKIFCATFERLANNSYLLILDNNGKPVFYRHMPYPCYDFKLQNNGLLTYFQNNSVKFYAMDSSYNVVDSFYCGNGYETDLHDLIIKDNGNVLIMSYDPQLVDMSKIYPGGQKDATVIGLILQEVDRQRNVIFQWRSWDHFEILDGDNVNFSLGLVDYVHGNSIEIDHDGNYIISCRNMSEITKINRESGEVIYRLGGKNNQFNFLNDTIKFSYQHAFRKTNTGTYTLFDNGNFHNPKFSRASEYSINESARTAELVWEFRNSPGIYTFAMGYVERLPNGNTSISWGFAPVSFTEVTPSKEKVFEMNFDTTTVSYRMLRADWKIDVPEIPAGFVITGSYPNPFNGFTHIYFSLPNNSAISLKIFDILGKEVKTLIPNSTFEAGSHTATLDAGSLTSGIYFYRLMVNDVSYSGKMVLIR